MCIRDSTWTLVYFKLRVHEGTASDHSHSGSAEDCACPTGQVHAGHPEEAPQEARRLELLPGP
eukprot:6989708-Alexandrium_andersonii.AAC.1